MPEDVYVQCVKCGFLALRSVPDRKLEEADQEYRETGKLPSVPVDRKNIDGFIVTSRRLYDVPFCIKQATNLPEAVGVPVTSEATLIILGQPRICPSFMEWHPGFSPKEHVEMDWQQKMAADERKWREDQAKQDHQWRKEDRASGRWNLVIGAMIGIVGAMATIVAAKIGG